MDDYDFFFGVRGLRSPLSGLGGEASGECGTSLDDLLFQPFGTDFVERARGNLGGGNAQFLGLRENFFVLETKFLCDVVDTNGHNYFSLPPTGLCDSPAWLKSQNHELFRWTP
jgi:hypothetical protein